jgi:hypothetical protein
VSASVDGQGPAPEDQAGRKTRAPAATEVVDGLVGAPWLLALAGLIAGLVAFGIGEATYKVIPARLAEVRTPGSVVMAPSPETQAVADVRNAALAFAVLGGLLGGFLGIVGGLARRSGTAAAGAGLLGLLAGAGLPACVSLATIQRIADARAIAPDYDMALSMLMHGLIWGLIGAVSGLAFAVGTGRWRLFAHAALAGLVGAVVAAIAFDLLGAAFFPTADTGDPVSTTWPTRLMARLLVALATVVGVILSLPGAALFRHDGRPTPPVGSGTPRAS